MGKEMNLEAAWCADLESDDLLEGATKIHVFSYANKKDGEWVVGSTNRAEDIKRFFIDPTRAVVIHNGCRFDAPLVEKLLGIEVKAVVIDSLALAWYIDHGRPWNQYGLEWYGESFGVPKPPVGMGEWKTISYERAKERCQEDVKITIKLWEKLLTKLRQVYDSDEDIIRVIKYLNFIMKCAYKQEEQKIEIDLEKVKSNMTYFESLKEEKVVQLKVAMPKVPIKRTVKKPKEMYKKNGDLTVAGQRWVELLPGDAEEVEIVTGYQEANPNSVPQKKAWLYSLGWKPQTFSYKRDKGSREVKKIEQILTEEKTLCPSVLKLKEKDPAIEVLDGISVLTHRIGIFKSLLENNKDGFIVQGLSQLAVTLRWQHSVVVNFPKVTGKGDIRDGKWIRECLIAGKGKKIVQSDLSGIESRTSDHYTFPYNPELIKETQQKYFDPHTKIAVASNLMTEDEQTFYKWRKENKERKERGLEELPVSEFGSLSSSFVVDDEKQLMGRLKLARHKAKTTNYSSLYGISPPTLARNLEITEREAKRLIDGYWKVNFGVKKVTETFIIKEVGEEKWILNPMSKFWHHLRHKHKAFSTVNQSSATYVFNIWLSNITQNNIWPIGQTHDDCLFRVGENEAGGLKSVILRAMEVTNRQLKLNVPLACEVQVGQSVAETH